MATHTVNRAKYPITKYPYWKALASEQHFNQLAHPAHRVSNEQVTAQMIERRAMYKKQQNERRKKPIKSKRAKMQTCPCCLDPQSLTVERRRLDTYYVDDESNYQESCVRCFEESVAFHQKFWEEFYSSPF